MMPEGYKRATYRGIPCYYNEEEYDLLDINRFYGTLISIALFIDIEVLKVEGFNIWIETEDYD